MDQAERAIAILDYQPYDRVPVIHFGYWRETLVKWASEGHIPAEWARNWGDGNPVDLLLNQRLGFDHGWQQFCYPNGFLDPGFTHEVIRKLPDGSEHVRDGNGVVLLRMPGAGSIPAEIEHLLVDRPSFEQHYRHRLQWRPARVDDMVIHEADGNRTTFATGGLALLTGPRPYFLGLHLGSLLGNIRNVIGVEGLAYLQADDPALLAEIVALVGDLCYRNAERVLAAGARFAYAHYWEDICYRNGPLVSPTFFSEVIGPHYRRITGLLHRHGIHLIGVDCDGCIDTLLPIWLENGVNVMFPIEVGTWSASLEPWRGQYGRELRGVGGMDKRAFARDRAAVDAEVERLARLVDLGGYIPCPDHRIAPDACFELVCYYCAQMRKRFG